MLQLLLYDSLKVPLHTWRYYFSFGGEGVSDVSFGAFSTFIFSPQCVRFLLSHPTWDAHVTCEHQLCSHKTALAIACSAWGSLCSPIIRHSGSREIIGEIWSVAISSSILSSWPNEVCTILQGVWCACANISHQVPSLVSSLIPI